MKKKVEINNNASLRTPLSKLAKFSALILTLLTAHFSLLTSSCEQPFKAGLGPIIDLRDPTILLVTPTAGAYIRGVTEFTGTAEDDAKLDTVWFRISNYPEVELPPTYISFKFKVGEDTFYKITDTTDISGSNRKITWKFSIDTKMLDENGERVFPDGDFMIRLRVRDAVGKEAITDEILFYIKNDIPEIIIDDPPIVQGTQDGELGGSHLNYNYLGLDPDPSYPKTLKRDKFTESFLVGRISDFEGINKEEGIVQLLDNNNEPVFDAQGNPKTVELFPPQIRFWHVNFNGSTSDDDAFEAGVVPTEEQVPWVKIGMGGVGEFIGGDGVKNRIFTYTLPDKSGQYYAFQVRAQSVDVSHSTALYPRDYFANFDDRSEGFKKENAYVLIRLVEPLEYPVLALYQLEDIYGAPSGGKPSRSAPAAGAANGAMQYNRLPEITDQIEKDGNHVYVDKPIVTKNGAFTLRMKASHSQDLSSVKVYWEKDDDKSNKGRFIWDWIDRPHPEFAGIIPSRSNPYYTWGLNEWDGVGKTTYNSMVRSFVFTYNDDGNDKVPDAADYYPDMRGRSKVQRYVGPDTTLDDKGNPKKYSLDELPEEKAGWADVSRLAEGTYTLSVYATSMGGTRIANPFVIAITIDRTKPEIELNDILGRAGEIDEELNDPVLVNGVIQPKFTISDSRAGSTPYFVKAGDDYYPERMYILVKETNIANKTVKDKLDEHFAVGRFFDNSKNIWPEFNASNIPADIGDVEILKHGLIYSSACRFRTSPIYHITPLPSTNTDTGDSLADGVYWVYAFVRDNAFNVGSLSFPIEVKADSDYPIFEWGEDDTIGPGVTEPDSAYDVDGDSYTSNPDKSFIAKKDGSTVIRNKLEPGASILVNIADDDSLDLGGVQGGDPSGIKVTFIGSKPDNTGKIEIRPSGDEITLTDAEVKAAFPPQTNSKGERIAAKTGKGTINQTVLLNGIKAKNSYNDLFGLPTNSLSPTEQAVKDSFSSLPDGIYRVGITISDYQGAKMKMEPPYTKPADEDPRAADVVTVNINNKVISPTIIPPGDNTEVKTEYFWIAVDSKPPVVVIDYSENDGDGKTNPSGKPISTTGTSPLVGSVYDENGPIKLVKWEVRDILKNIIVSSNTNVAPGQPKIITSDPNKPAIGISSPVYLNGKWKYNFNYEMAMNGNTEGAYNFEITYKDRFNNETTQTLTYAVDTEKPKVSLMKPIETFSRPYADVDLHTGDTTNYPQNPASVALNKERLAVKVVNFSINVVDNIKVKGVHWWLLPYNKGASTDSGFDGTGIVSIYNAFPSQEPQYQDPGTYYPANGGAYGVLDDGGQFTIAIDTNQMIGGQNGEYRLHIIAIDGANNSSVTVTPAIVTGSHVFQEVFFLQEEDRPYFGELDNITPGVVVTGTQWPGGDMDVRRGNLLVRGTIFENNGFLAKTVSPAPAAPYDTFWEGSLTIWFSDTDADAEAALPNDWETTVANDGVLTGYTKKKIPNDKGGIGKQGRNISLAIQLSELFPTAFPTDGKKRYIIKATDSPVNKLWYGVTGDTKPSIPGTPMGAGNTDTQDALPATRVSRWRQFAYVYDGKPPVVVITKPNEDYPGNKFGTNFADTDKGFNLVGSMSDMNLATVAYYYENLPSGHPDLNGKPFTNGKYTGADKDYYYFEYYVDSNASARTKFFLDTTITGVNVTGPVDAGDTKVVTFDIKPEVVASSIIKPADFEALTEGQHTLNIFAFDKSGQEGAGWVSFTKDMKPPTIAFTNLAGDNRPYDSTNKSKVDKPGTPGVTGWWGKTQPQKQGILLTNNNFNNVAASPAKPLSDLLTTITYDTGIPELWGTITDLVSNIELIVSNAATPGSPSLTDHAGAPISSTAVGTGDVNTSDSSFKYWIDNESLTDPGRHLALIDGAGTRSVRWTINLTNNLAAGDGKAGTTGGKPLYDGVHTIVLTAADEAGQKIQPDDCYMIAFRIDSKQPKATVNVSGNSAGVYGNADYQNDTMFTLTMTASDANLEKMELRIIREGETEPTVKTTFTPISTTPQGATATWTYTPGSSSVDDAVTFSGTYPVPKFANTVPSGKYEAIVASYDTAGNKSEEFIFPFTYDKDRPDIVFTNPDKTNAAGTNNTLKPEDFINLGRLPELLEEDGTTKNNINRLTSENLRIQGSVTDDFSAIKQVQSRVEKWNWNGAAAGTWTVVEDWKNVRDDLYYPVAANAPPDPRNNKLTQISWTKNLLGQNVGDLDLVTGLSATTARTELTAENLAAAEGLYRIRIRAKDSSVIAHPWFNGGNDGWDYPTGEGNPRVSPYVYFYFDRTNPELKITKINGADATLSTYYTNPPSGGFTFAGTVKDNNRFAKVEVTFDDGVTVPPITRTAVMSSILTTPNQTDPAPTINTGGVTQNWFASGFTAGNATLPDGRYKVTIVVYDMTGKSAREEKSFILDSTKPTVKFTLPAKQPRTGANSYSGFGDDSENPKPPPVNTANGFASVTVLGGETTAISGVTEDKPGAGSASGSESGIDQMWFRLGFIDGATYDTANPFPTKAAIEADETRLATAAAGFVIRGANESDAAYRNRVMNYVAEYRGNDNNLANSWFKLGGTEKPTGFVINNPNIYDWRFEIPDKYPISAGNTVDLDASGYTQVTPATGEKYYQIGGLKLYCSEITVKGRKYYVNPTGNTPNRQMVRAVSTGGIYRLPLWVRITDIAGNVEYYCHDIWIDANGDIPSTSIESPSNASRANAKGGAISVDGVAKSNTSVYDVIFRVFADGVANTDLDGTTKTVGAKPGDNGYDLTTNLVRITGYDAAPNTTVNKLPTAYQNTAWQRANLTLPGGSGEPLVPWSIMLNSGDQIKNLISSRGFNGSTGNATPKDMIRVWLEVFVFNGEGQAPTPPIRSSIYPNDNLNTGNGTLYGTAATDGAKPYVRAFYIKENAPAITHPNVGTWTANYVAPSPTPTPAPFARANFTWNGENAQNQGGGGYAGAGTEMRSKRFAFSATLDPSPTGGSGGLGEVAYRVKLDGGSYGGWTTVWKTGDPAITNNNADTRTPGVRISFRDTPAGKGTRYYFDYAIASDSTTNVTDSNTTLIPVPGANWVNTGGTITLQIRMRDNSTPPNEAEQTIQVGVDNFAPVGDPNSYGNSTVAGTNVNFIGRVYDYATAPPTDAMPRDSDYAPKKLKRVYAWFTKTTTGANAGTYYVNMNTGALGKTAGTTTGGTPATASMSAFSGRTPTIVGGGASDNVTSITIVRGTPGPIYVPQKAAGETSYNAAWVREIDQATGQPQYKMLWAPVNSAVYDVRWSFTLDSTKLPDGKLTLHYVVEDEAGNASYYTQPDITVKNRYPEITRVTLYTDNNGQGAAFTKDDTIEYDLNDYRGKMFANYTDTTDKPKSDSTGYLNSGFISKNNYIGFKVETIKGNRPLTFRLQYVKRTRVPLTSAKLQELLRLRDNTNNINLYTIAWHGDYSSANWKAIGVPAETNPTLGTHFILQWPEGSNLTGGTANGTLPANYKSSTTAEVWQYTYTAAATKNPPKPTGPAQSEDPAVNSVVLGPDASSAGGVDFNFKGTTDFASIDERDGSHPDVGDTKTDNPVSDDATGTAFFLIRVWDAVGGEASGEAAINERLNDALVVGMNVYKRDNIDPVARLYDLNPYTETAVANSKNDTIRNAANPNAIGSNIVRGGLYNDGTTRDMVRSGFINPRGGSKFLDPKNGLYDNEGTKRQLINGLPLPDYPLKVTTDTVPANGLDQVSGKIILRGIAWDDQLIDEIRINVAAGTGNTDGVILKLNSSGKMAAASGGIRNGQTVAFVAEELHWKTGHTVEWAYIWDTGNAPVTSQLIQVSVKDKKGTATTPPTAPPANPEGRTSDALTTNPDTANADGTLNRFHNQVNVAIVPYITGFERHKPEFTTKRSLQGWYSFYQGEGVSDGNTIKVLGYNFGTTAGTITLNGTSVGTVSGTTGTERIFSIPNTATSGEIIMTTSVPAYNNGVTMADIATKSWNREWNVTTPGSDLWINKPYAHIWRTAQDDNSPRTYIGTTTSSSGLDHPGMTLEYASGGLLHGAWAVYGNANVYHGTNTGASYRLEADGSNNPPNEPYIVPDISIFNGTGAANMGYGYQRDGNTKLLVNASVNTDGTGTAQRGTDIQAGTESTTTLRWRNIRISKREANSGTGSGDVGRIYMTAHDSANNSLWYGTRSGGTNNPLFIDGGNATAGIGGTGASGSAGEYSAVDYDDTGPIIAYYDQTNDTVRVALGSQTAATAAGNFTRKYLLDSSHALYKGSGKYISIKVDKDNHIHLAFYNSVYNTVVYAYAASRTANFTAYAVDRVTTCGTWTDISVDNSGNPWIVYGDTNRTSNYDGVRIAYKGGFIRTLADPVVASQTITGWEALTMPANYSVNNDRLNIEAWPPTLRGGSLGTAPVWQAAIGYASDLFRVGYFFKPTVPTGF